MPSILPSDEKRGRALHNNGLLGDDQEQCDDDNDSTCTNLELARLMDLYFPDPSEIENETFTGNLESFKEYRRQPLTELSFSSSSTSSDENDGVETNSPLNFVTSIPLPSMNIDTKPGKSPLLLGCIDDNSKADNRILERVIHTNRQDSTTTSTLCHHGDPLCPDCINRSDWRMDPEDVEVTKRALRLQEELRRQEMEELALEAERAAEAGKTKFLGFATTFTLIESSHVANDDDSTETDDHHHQHHHQQQHTEEDTTITGGTSYYPLHQYHCATPPQVRRQVSSSSRSPFSMSNPLPMLRCENNTNRHSPTRSGAYYKKRSPFLPFNQYMVQPQRVGVRDRRLIHEVIPPFKDMHTHLRMHLSRSHIDQNILVTTPPPTTRIKQQQQDSESTINSSNVLVKRNAESTIEADAFDPIKSMSNLVFISPPSSKKQQEICMKSMMGSLPSVLNCGEDTIFEEQSSNSFDWTTTDQHKNILALDNSTNCSDPEHDNSDENKAVYVSILASEINDPLQEHHDIYTLPPSPYSEDEQEFPISQSPVPIHHPPWVAKVLKTFESFVPPSPRQKSLAVTPEYHLGSTPNKTDELHDFKLKEEEQFKNEQNTICKVMEDTDSVLKKQATFSDDDDHDAIQEDADINDSPLTVTDKTCTNQDNSEGFHFSHPPETISVLKSNNNFLNLNLNMMDFQPCQTYKMMDEVTTSSTRMEKLEISSRFSRNTESTAPLSDDSSTSLSHSVGTLQKNEKMLTIKKNEMTMSTESKRKLYALCTRFEIVPNIDAADFSIEKETVEDEAPVEVREEAEIKTFHSQEIQCIPEENAPVYNSFDKGEEIEEGKEHNSVVVTEEKSSFLNDNIWQLSSKLLGDAGESNVCLPVRTLSSSSLDELNPSHPRASPIAGFFDQVGRLSPFSWTQKAQTNVFDKSDIVFIENYFYTPKKTGEDNGVEKLVSVNGEKKAHFCDAADEQCAEIGMSVGCDGISSAVFAAAKVFLPQQHRSHNNPKVDISTRGESTISQDVHRDEDVSVTNWNDFNKEENGTHLYSPPRLTAKLGALQVCIDEDDSFSIDTNETGIMNEWTDIQHPLSLQERNIDLPIMKTLSESNLYFQDESIHQRSLLRANLSTKSFDNDLIGYNNFTILTNDDRLVKSENLSLISS